MKKLIRCVILEMNNYDRIYGSDIMSPGIKYDKWSELKKWLASCTENRIDELSVGNVLSEMDNIDKREQRLIEKYWTDYERSKVIIHCSKCGSKMELIPDPHSREEIICPFMGCNQSTGMKGYDMVSAGGK